MNENTQTKFRFLTSVQRQLRFHLILCSSRVFGPLETDSIRWAIELLACSILYAIDLDDVDAPMMVYRCKSDTEHPHHWRNHSLCPPLRIGFLSPMPLCKTLRLYLRFTNTQQQISH